MLPRHLLTAFRNSCWHRILLGCWQQTYLCMLSCSCRGNFCRSVLGALTTSCWKAIFVLKICLKQLQGLPKYRYFLTSVYIMPSFFWSCFGNDDSRGRFWVYIVIANLQRISWQWTDVHYGCSDIIEVVSWLLTEDTEASDVMSLGREFHSGTVLGEKDFWYLVVLQRGLWSFCCVTVPLTGLHSQ